MYRTFTGNTQLEVTAAIARCGTNTSAAAEAIRVWIESKQAKDKPTEHILAKLEVMEQKYMVDPSIHEAFHCARAITQLPRSRILPPSLRYQPSPAPAWRASKDSGSDESTSTVRPLQTTPRSSIVSSGRGSASEPSLVIPVTTPPLPLSPPSQSAATPATHSAPEPLSRRRGRSSSIHVIHQSAAAVRNIARSPQEPLPPLGNSYLQPGKEDSEPELSPIHVSELSSGGESSPVTPFSEYAQRSPVIRACSPPSSPRISSLSSADRPRGYHEFLSAPIPESPKLDAHLNPKAQADPHVAGHPSPHGRPSRPHRRHPQTGIRVRIPKTPLPPVPTRHPPPIPTSERTDSERPMQPQFRRDEDFWYRPRSPRRPSRPSTRPSDDVLLPVSLSITTEHSRSPDVLRNSRAREWTESVGQSERGSVIDSDSEDIMLTFREMIDWGGEHSFEQAIRV